MNGVIYSLSGPAYAELLTVSLWTLRQHYSGPVAVFCGPGCREAAAPLPDDPRLRPVELIDMDLPQVPRHAHYCVKPSVALASPFDATVFLDADTLVCGEIDELFGYPLAVTRFSNWVTTGKIIGGRIRQWMAGGEQLVPHDAAYEVGQLIPSSTWRGVTMPARVLEIEPRRGDSPRIARLVDAAACELARRQLELPRPAINTGVFAFHRSQQAALAAWEELTLRNWRCSFTDELAMQLLWEYAGGVCLDDRWNWSVRFGRHAEPIIKHLHGRKHVRERNADWWAAYREARAADVAGIAFWGGMWDRAVGEMQGD